MAKNKVEIIVTAKDKTSKVFGKIKSSFGALAGLGKKLGLVMGGATAAMIAIAKTTANAGDQFQKMSLKLGVSAQSLSEMKHAAELSGTSIEAVANGMRLLAKRMLDANEGLAESARTFDNLGIKVVDSEGKLREINDVFMDSFDALKNLTSETEKVALAQELFGRSGVELMPLVKAGADGIKAMRKEARELGITFTELEANQAAAFNDSLTRLGGVIKGVKNSIGKALIPEFEKLATTMTNVMKKLRAEGKIDVWAAKISENTIILFQLMFEAMMKIPQSLKAIQTTTDSAIARLIKFVRIAQTIITLGLWTEMIDELKKAEKEFLDASDAATKSQESYAAFADNIIAKIKQLKKEISGVKDETDELTTGRKITILGIDIEAYRELMDQVKGLTRDTEIEITSLKGDEVATRKALIDRDFQNVIKGIEQEKEAVRQMLEDEKIGIIEVSEFKAAIGLQELAAERLHDQQLVELKQETADLLREQMLVENAFILDSDAGLREKMRAGWENHFILMEDMSNQFVDATITAFENMRTGFGDAMGKMIVFNEDFGTAMKSTMKNIAADFISKLSEMLVQYVLFEEAETKIRILESARRVAVTIAAKAKEWAVTLATFVKTMLIYAKEAAAAAFKSLAGIPFIGWALGIAAAIAAFAFVTGMASFKKGTGLKGLDETGPVFAHAGEIILNNKESDQLRENSRSGSIIPAASGSASITVKEFNFMPNSSIDEALMNKPPTYWARLIKKNILPALNELGANNATISTRFSGAKI